VEAARIEQKVSDREKRCEQKIMENGKDRTTNRAGERNSLLGFAEN
jgi:hypothetical protein